MHLFRSRPPVVRKPFFVEERTVVTRPARRSFHEAAHKLAR